MSKSYFFYWISLLTYLTGWSMFKCTFMYLFYKVFAELFSNKGGKIWNYILLDREHSSKQKRFLWAFRRQWQRCLGKLQGGKMRGKVGRRKKTHLVWHTWSGRALYCVWPPRGRPWWWVRPRGCHWLPAGVRPGRVCRCGTPLSPAGARR